ncbi:hypothetical protein, partial [Klebsiella pneumoniae]|uniref:hypothetical protein n=1 Tax=Klebsiella pneumoniae TaxID=573 RepID=UPI000B40CC08
LMMSLWDALRMNMMISYQELVRTFPKENCSYSTLLLLCKDKGQVVSEPLDGDIVISSGHSTVYWRGKVIILSEDKTNYIVSQYIPNEKDKIYRFKGE